MQGERSAQSGGGGGALQGYMDTGVKTGAIIVVSLTQSTALFLVAA